MNPLVEVCFHFLHPIICRHAKQDCAISWRKHDLTYDLVFMLSAPAAAAGFHEGFAYFYSCSESKGRTWSGPNSSRRELNAVNGLQTLHSNSSFNKRGDLLWESEHTVLSCNWKLRFVCGGHKEALDKDCKVCVENASGCCIIALNYALLRW